MVTPEEKQKSKKSPGLGYELLGCGIGLVFLLGLAFLLFMFFGQFEVGSTMYYVQGITLFLFLALLIWFIFFSVKAYKEEKGRAKDLVAKYPDSFKSYIDQDRGEIILCALNYPTVNSVIWTVDYNTIRITTIKTLKVQSPKDIEKYKDLGETTAFSKIQNVNLEQNRLSFDVPILMKNQFVAEGVYEDRVKPNTNSILFDSTDFDLAKAVRDRIIKNK